MKIMINTTDNGKNDLFYDQPVISVANNIFNENISLIIGSNNCELCLSFDQNAKQDSNQFYSHWLPKYGADIVNQMIIYYNVPINQSNDINLINYTIEIATDTFVKCPSRNVLESTSKYNSNNNNNINC